MGKRSTHSTLLNETMKCWNHWAKKVRLEEGQELFSGPLWAERCGNSPQLLHGIDPQLKVIVPASCPANLSDSGPRFWKNLLCLRSSGSCLFQLNLLVNIRLTISVDRGLHDTSSTVLTDTAGVIRNHENFRHCETRINTKMFNGLSSSGLSSSIRTATG